MTGTSHMVSKMNTQSRVRKTAVKAVLYLVLLGFSFVLLLPFFWLISSSLKEPTKVFSLPIQWIPNPVIFNNFVRIFVDYDFHRYLLNSAWLTGLNIVLYLTSCSLVAYAFATQRWKYKNRLFMLIIATMMLPGDVTFYPQFILYKTLGMYGTMMPLWLPGLFGDAFLIFLMRQFFLAVSIQMAEAAKIDGCSRLRVYTHIYMPLSKPVMASAAIFVFMAKWNDFFAPLIYITREPLRTAALALMYLRSSYEITSMLPLQMAAALVTAVPCLLLYYFAQRYFIAGIVFKGVDK